MSIRRQTTFRRAIKLTVHSAIAAAALAASVASASAQNIFESFFGRLFNPAGVSAYADPNAAPRNAERSEAGGTAYCVRTCDGRYFPIERHAGVTPAQACSSFCPAAETRIYNGSPIDQGESACGPCASAMQARPAPIILAAASSIILIPSCQ